MGIDAAVEDVRQRIRTLVADVLELDESEVADDADLSESFAADSLQHLELVSALEREYGVRFSADDWRDAMTVAGLTKVTLARLNAA